MSWAQAVTRHARLRPRTGAAGDVLPLRAIELTGTMIRLDGAVVRGLRVAPCHPELTRGAVRAAQGWDVLQLYVEHDAAAGTRIFLLAACDVVGRRGHAAAEADLDLALGDLRRELSRVGVPATGLDGAQMAALITRRLSIAAARGRDLPSLEVSGWPGPDHQDASIVAAQRLGELAISSGIDLSDDRHVRVGDGVEQVIHLAGAPNGSWERLLADPSRLGRTWTLSVHVRDDGEQRTLSVYHALREPDRPGAARLLAETVDRVAGVLAELCGTVVQRGEFRQRELWQSTLPLGLDVADLSFACSPTVALPVSVGDGAGLEGIAVATAATGNPLRLDLWSGLQRCTGVVVQGSSDDAVTATVDVLAERLADDGCEVVVVDRAGRHAGLGDAADPPAAPIWPAAGDPAAGPDRVAAILAVHAVLLGPLSFAQRRVLELSISEGLEAGRDDGPLERHVVDALRRRADTHPDARIRASATELMERLAPYVGGDGGHAWLLDRRPRVEHRSSPLTVVDLSGLPAHVAGALALSLADEGVAAEPSRRLVAIDDADDLLATPLALRRLTAAAAGGRSSLGGVLVVKRQRASAHPLRASWWQALLVGRPTADATIPLELRAGLRGRTLGRLARL